MNSVVEAAWIAGASGLVGVVVGVTGTTIVAVVGFRSTRKATEDTNQTTTATNTATIVAARDGRLYDKRSEVYIDLLVVVSRAQQRRNAMSNAIERGVPPGESPDLPLVSADFQMIEARLQAFGTVEAFTRVQAYSAAAKEAEDWWLIREDGEESGNRMCATAIGDAENAAQTVSSRGCGRS
jgi:hypothetical protein